MIGKKFKGTNISILTFKKIQIGLGMSPTQKFYWYPKHLVDRIQVDYKLGGKTFFKIFINI